MEISLYEQIKDLCADELLELYSSIYRLLDNKQISKNSNHNILFREKFNDLSCPKCGSTQYNRNGKTKANRQKYRCKECHKSFSDTTQSVLCSSKKSFKEWNTFIDCEFKRMTLKETAYCVGISVTSAFSWRHKLHKAVEKYIKSMKLSGKVQLDAIYTGINLKGTLNKNMPRYSKKRPSSKYRGISHHKVCIMSGIDTNDNMFFQVTGLGREAISHYHEIISRLENPTLLVTDQAWGYTTFSKDINCELDQIPTTAYISDKGNSLAELNGLHSQLSSYLKKYRGVSIRHLQGYLDMFLFIKSIKYKYENDCVLRQSYINSIPSQAVMKVENISSKKLPIDLFAAYGEYNHGCFSNNNQYFS